MDHFLHDLQQCYFLYRMSLLTLVVLVAKALPSRALFFVMSLLFIIPTEISTPSFCVNGFIVILLLPLLLIEQHFFHQRFYVYGGRFAG